MIATTFYLMIGAGVALGVHCAFAERRDYLALRRMERCGLLLMSALFWPAPAACTVFLALCVAADR